MKRLLCAALAVASMTACGSGTKTPPQECEAVGAALAAAAQRCGGDYQANYQAFLGAAACGDCSTTISIRDQSALDSQCIPSFSTISCSDLESGTVDASCQMQLEHNAC